MTKEAPDYEIRPAGFEDAVAVFSLIRQHTDELLPRPIGDIVQNIDRFLVAFCDNKLCGVISWQILPEIGAPHRPSVELKSLAVAVEHQRKGVGKRLVEEAIKHVRPFHPVQIVALTFAPGFFAKLGFSEVRKEDLMHKIYAGCINCTKYDSPFTCPETAVALEIAAPEQAQ